jgi:hypothetical protein
MLVDYLASWGHARKSPGSAAPRFGLWKVFCKAALTLFASFSGKRRIVLDLFGFRGMPPNPLGRLRRDLGKCGLLRSGTTLFASFAGKRRAWGIGVFFWELNGEPVGLVSSCTVQVAPENYFPGIKRECLGIIVCM